MGRAAVHRRHGRPVGTPAPAPDTDYDRLVRSSGPVMYLSLDGTDAGLLDQTGRGHHATVTGDVAVGSGPGDGRGSVEFDGTAGNYLTVADHADLSVPTTGIITVEGWFAQSTDEFDEVEGSGYVQPMGKLAYGAACEWEVRLYSATNSETPPRPGRWSMYAFNSSCGLGTGSYFQDPTVTDQWVHVVGVINANVVSANWPTGYVKVYRDGILRDQDALSNFNVVPTDTTAPVHIGAASLDSFFAGRAARVAVYNYELSPAAIRSHYRALVPATPGSITQVRHVGTANNTAAGTSLTLTVPASGVPVGNTLLCRVAHDYTAAAPTMTDSRGNTYERDVTSPDAGNTIRGSLFRAHITTALRSGDLVQLTTTSAANRTLAVDEFEDVALLTPVQDTNSDSDTSTGPTLGSAPEVTTTDADAMVYGAVIVAGPSTDTYTEDSGGDFTGLTAVHAGTAITSHGAWKSVNGTSTFAYTPTLGTSRVWVELIAAYKAGPVAAPVSAYDAEVLAAGPVCYLTLDGTADGLLDQTGRGHDATAHGSPSAATGIGDGSGATEFDDSGLQYLEIPDHDELSVTETGVLAVEAWISPSTLEFTNEQPATPASDYVYWAGKAGAGENEWQCRMYSYSTPNLSPARSNRISVYVNNLGGGLGAGSYAQYPVQVDEWIHIVGIIDSRPSVQYGAQGYTRIYRNGVLVHTDDIASYDITPGNGTAPVRIGTSSLGSFFEGRVCKFAIWDREPTAQEIQTRYAIAAPPEPPAPTGTADFQQEVGSAMATSSGTTLTVTLTQGIPVGHTLFVHTNGDYTATNPTVTDSRGNTYVIGRGASDAGNTFRAGIFSAPVETALQAGDTVTVTWPSSISRRAALVTDFTKLAIPVVLDASNGSTNTGTSPSVSTPTTYGDDLLIGMIAVAGPVTDGLTQDTAHQWNGLTRVGTSGAGTPGDDRTINAAYRAVPQTGTYTYAPTLVTSRTYVTMLVAYRASTYTPPPTPAGSAALVKHLGDASATSSGTTLVMTLAGGVAAGTRPATRADVPAGLKVSAGSLVAPTLPITGMTGSDTARNIVAPGVYEGYDFPGAVTILSNGVTLRNCRWLDSSDFWAVQSEGYDDVLIEDCTFDGCPQGIQGWGWTARRCLFVNLHADPFDNGSASGTGQPTIVEDCLAYDFRPGSHAHVDGVQQWVSGIDNLIVRRCWFETKVAAGYVLPDEESGFTSPIFLQSYPEAGTQGITLIADNVLDSDDYHAIRFEGAEEVHGAITCRPVALRNRMRCNPAVDLILGGVPYEGEGNVEWDGTPYHGPNEIAPGEGIPDDGGGAGTVVPTGHTVVVQVNAGYTSASPAVTDSRGNTYRLDRTGADTDHTIRVCVFAARVTTALQGGDTITVTWPVSVTRRVAVADEFSGVLVPIVVDANNGRAGNTAAPSVTATTLTADDLLIGAVGVAGPAGDVFDDDSLWNGLTGKGTTGAGTADRTLHAAWRSVDVAGSYTYAPELGTPRVWVAAFVAYKGG